MKKDIFNSSFPFTWRAIKSLPFDTAKEQGTSTTGDPSQHSPRQGKDLQLSRVSWGAILPQDSTSQSSARRPLTCQDSLPPHASCPWVDERGTGAQPFPLLSFGASQGQHWRRSPSLHAPSTTAWSCPAIGEQPPRPTTAQCWESAALASNQRMGRHNVTFLGEKHKPQWEIYAFPRELFLKCSWDN